MIKSYPHVETEKVGPVLVIRLDNEKARNSLTREMRYSLRDIVREIEDDHTVRAVYLTGKGPTFCAGGDLRMLTKAADPWPVHRRFRHAAALFPPLVSLNRPVVCGVRGMAIGGGMGLALMSDVLIAGSSAQFGAGFFRLGVVPDCLTMFTLPRMIGLSRTRNFLYTGATWSAEEAVENGVALKVVPDEEVDAEGLALATKLAEGPAEVMGLAKQIMLKSFETSLAEMMDYEDFGQVLAMSSAEFREGLSALIEKRKPDYIGAATGGDYNDGLPASVKPE
ncbi:enoyl-CoA hydratase/isomerase family protein [Celeribacter indicus]|uniref:Enoyl-CoA hydratase/isomerase n=1 Tax=Celeribacter indicus TaxID=1208324 RepID=A0A0B5E1L5_9RHOB|nr:enoyl-CoA hydratase/isomerase family protein [Celeribacter indicus]AJE49144.1 enoyl-CoA hydratase/isomerase [Celeribacter indicus]SDX17507.1 Enoyl-CoA hydratase [Celeribacter indicus]